MSKEILRVLRRGRELSRLWDYPRLTVGEGYQAAVVEFVRLRLGLTPGEADALRLAFLPGNDDYSDGATLTAYGATLAMEAGDAKPGGDLSGAGVYLRSDLPRGLYRKEGEPLDFDFVACWVASVGVGARASDLAGDLADGDHDGGEQ